MRLICPKCDAEYEVEAAAIPETGRDVQCSNCGHGWYQMPVEPSALLSAADDDLAPAMAAALVADVRSLAAIPAVETASTDNPGRDQSVEQGAAVTAGFAVDDDSSADRDVAASDPSMTAAVRPRALEQSVLSVLREEAEREAAARRAEMALPATTEIENDTLIENDKVIETVPATAVEPARQAVAMVTAGAAVPAGEAESALPRHGRELLPDVEEVNSILRPVADDDGGETQLAQPPAGGIPLDNPARSGFGSGFALMIIFAGVLVALYALAPELSAQIPAVQPAMEQYVATVDILRLYLDGWMRSAIIAINGQS
jgi:predicted Zn finger-like uncharacterized protein